MKLIDKIYQQLFPMDYALKQLKKEMIRKNIELEREWQRKYGKV